MRANKGRGALIVFSVLTLFLLAATLIYFFAQPRFSDIELHYNKTHQPLTLPYKADTESSIHTFEVQLQVRSGYFSSAMVQVIPDDCLRALYINGSSVDLSKVQGLCDWNNGALIHIGDYLGQEENRFRLVFEDRGGKRGADIRPVIAPWVQHLHKAAAALWLFWIAYMLMLRLRFSSAVAIMFALGMALRLLYLMETPWSIRTYDVDGHIEYIIHIATHGVLPQANACWTCYHPPLYYLLAGAVYKAGLLISKPVALDAVQMLSLILSGAFALFMLLSLRLMRLSRSALLLSATLLLFYPSLVMHAARIGNDVLQYPAYAGAIYFYLRWLKGGSGLTYSTLFVAVAVFAKANGVVLMAVLGVSYLIRMLWLGEWKNSRRTVFVVTAFYVLIIAGAVGLHVSRSDKGLVSNAQSLNHALFVENTVASYLYFDPRIMIKEAYTSAWENGKGREYFWNYFWQTSLFGEFRHSEALRGVASAISFMLIGMLSFAVMGFLLVRKEDVVEALPYMANTFFLVVAAMYLRYSIPAACSNDFRYSIPLILSLSYFLGKFLDYAREREWIVMSWVVQALVVLFALLSSIFVANLR